MMGAAGAGAVAVALAISACAIALLARLSARLPQAAPNARSLHLRAVPRAGGYAIWAGFLPVAVIVPPAIPGSLFAWLPPWLALVAISACDDRRGVSVGARFATHLGAALWCAAWMLAQVRAGSIDPDVRTLASVAALALVLAWSANLYNFMDGSDGIAAAMTLCGFAAYGAAALLADASPVAYFALAAATLPFLVVNRPRATMFLGDVGSVPLGFLAAAFGAGGVLTGLWPAWYPVLVFLPFIADATLTLARRAVRGEAPASPHKDHYYQRLHQLGAGHAGTLVAYGSAMAGTAGTALVCLALAPAWGMLALAAWSVVCFTLFAAITYHWRRMPSAPP
jgi:UDP-N-acetylmuramyl pentapeptide phosphotransferase/UDP-N-acetylglucosamine-1-phosphate transferase